MRIHGQRNHSDLDSNENTCQYSPLCSTRTDWIILPVNALIERSQKWCAEWFDAITRTSHSPGKRRQGRHAISKSAPSVSTNNEELRHIPNKVAAGDFRTLLIRTNPAKLPPILTINGVSAWVTAIKRKELVCLMVKLNGRAH